MKLNIKKGDQVYVLTGKDRGKKGTVIAILPKKGKVIVKDIALVTRHVKAKKQGDISGIRREERFIHISNVMPVKE
jgi:large subunit ribosomal protein L24